MLQNLIETCKKLEPNWQRESFPELARKTLENFSVESLLGEFESQVARWIENNKLPPQLNLYNNFGEPSLTVFNNGKFAADIYFWRKNDTLIHSHGFRGAFKIVHGVSLHEEFEVETIKAFSEDVLKTKLSQKKIHVMKTGDVQKIKPDMELTHRVVHLENPTVSLCLRTVEDTALNQWHHLPAGLSFQKKHTSEKTIKQILYFQYLLGSDSKYAHEFYLKLLCELDISSKIALYESLCFDQLGLEPETSEVAGELLQDLLRKTEWFEFYEKHYENLQENLQEHQIQNPALKIVAHAINSGHSKDQTQRLLSQFSDQGLQNLCEQLKKTTSVFTEGFEDLQIKRIDAFKK